MKKTICLGIISVGILGSLSSCYAFDYRSEEAGFSVDIPDNNTVIVSKDLFVAGSNKAGMHGITAISRQSIEAYTKAEFATNKFEEDLKNIAADIKAGKDILAEPAYAYLLVPQNELQVYMQKLMQDDMQSLPGKKSYKITKINKIPALEINNDMLLNYKIELPSAYGKKERQAVQKYNPYVKFSADGKQMTAQYNLISRIHILSQNDQLYNISSGYVEFPANEEAQTTIEKDETDKFIQQLMDNKVDKRAYNKLSKEFTKKLQFFKPQASDSELVIKDGIFNKDFKIPHNWLYIQSNQKLEATPISFFSALPLSSLEKIGKEYLDSKLFNIKTTNAGIDVESTINTTDFDFGKVLKAYSEGVIGISAEYKPTRSNDQGLKQFLENPAFTEMMFNEFMNKPFLNPREKAKLEKFLQVKSFTHDININKENCQLQFTYDIDLHLPKNLSKINQPDYDIWQETELTNLSIYGQKKIYFDAANRINLLCYFTQDKAMKSDLLQKEYENYDLFKNSLLKEKY